MGNVSSGTRPGAAAAADGGPNGKAGNGGSGPALLTLTSTFPFEPR